MILHKSITLNDNISIISVKPLTTNNNILNYITEALPKPPTFPRRKIFSRSESRIWKRIRAKFKHSPQHTANAKKTKAKWQTR